MRSVDDALGDQMRHAFYAALNIAFDQNEPRTHHLLAKGLHHLRPYHDISDAGFVLYRHEHDALRAAWTLPHQNHTSATHGQPVIAFRDVVARHDVLAR